MESDVARFVKSCDTCQRVKIPRERASGPSRPLPLPERKGEIMHLDFFTGLPLRDSCDSVLVIVERYSRYPFLIPVSSSCSSSDLIRLLCHYVLAIFGAPKVIVSERGTLFTSKAWRKELDRIDTERRLATGHPQTNGASEHAVQMAKQILRTLKDRRRWEESLHEVTLALNSWPFGRTFFFFFFSGRTTGVSPYYVLFGQTPPLSFGVGAESDGGMRSEGHHLAHFQRALNKIEQSRALVPGLLWAMKTFMDISLPICKQGSKKGVRLRQTRLWKR